MSFFSSWWSPIDNSSTANEIIEEEEREIAERKLKEKQIQERALRNKQKKVKTQEAKPKKTAKSFKAAAPAQDVTVAPPTDSFGDLTVDDYGDGHELMDEGFVRVESKKRRKKKDGTAEVYVMEQEQKQEAFTKVKAAVETGEIEKQAPKKTEKKVEKKTEKKVEKKEEKVEKNTEKKVEKKEEEKTVKASEKKVEKKTEEKKGDTSVKTEQNSEKSKKSKEAKKEEEKAQNKGEQKPKKLEKAEESRRKGEEQKVNEPTKIEEPVSAEYAQLIKDAKAAGLTVEEYQLRMIEKEDTVGFKVAGRKTDASTKKIKKLEAEVKRLTTNAATLEKTIERIDNERKVSNNARKTAEKDSTEFKSKLDLASAKIASLEAEPATPAMSAETISEIRNLRQECANKDLINRNLTQSLEEFKSQVIGLSQHNKNLSGEMVIANNQMNQLNHELNVKAQETAQVSFILHECQRGHEELKRSNTRMNQENNNLRVLTDNLTHELQAANTGLKQAKDQNEEAAKNMNNLHNELLEARRGADSSAAAIHAASVESEKTIADLTAKLAATSEPSVPVDVQNQLDDALAESDKWESMAAAANAKIADADAKAKDAEAKAAEALKQVEEMKKAEVKKTDTEVKKVEDENKKIKEETKKIEDERKKMKEELKKVEEENKKIKEEMKKVEDERKQTQEKIVKVEQEKEKLEKDLKKAAETAQPAEDKNMMSVEAHTTEIEALNKKNRENNKALMEKVLAKSKAAEEKATAEKAAHDLLKEELKIQGELISSLKKSEEESQAFAAKHEADVKANSDSITKEVEALAKREAEFKDSQEALIKDMAAREAKLEEQEKEVLASVKAKDAQLNEQKKASEEKFAEAERLFNSIQETQAQNVKDRKAAQALFNDAEKKTQEAAAMLKEVNSSKDLESKVAALSAEVEEVKETAAADKKKAKEMSTRIMGLCKEKEKAALNRVDELEKELASLRA